jgi:predicted permease
MAQNDWLNRVRERLAAEGIAPSSHREALDEIAEHLNDLHRAAERDGKSDDEAAAIVEAELARMGSVAAAIRRRSRHANKGPDPGGWFAGVAADFRHGVRSIRLHRGFSSLAIVTLALAIGACTAVFSIINALLLGSLPYPSPEQLVIAMGTDRDNRAQTFIVSYPNYEDWRRDARSFTSMGIWEYLTFNVASAAEPEQVQGVRASASLFSVLGVSPALGRIFTDSEDESGHRVAVISDGLWRSHLGGRDSAIGTTLRLNGEPYEVIGVMPKGFQFPWRNNGVWIPLSVTDQDRQRGSQSFWVAARIKPEISFESAKADIEQVGLSLQQRYPQNQDEGATIQPMSEQGLARLRNMLTVLMAAVALVLVIACVNVANLQVGQALARRREFMLRLSLGAGFGRLVRQLFAESAVLAVAAAIGGLALAWLATRAADQVLAPGFRSLPYRGEVPITMDTRVFAFTIGITAITALLFGFVPMIGFRRRDPAVLLRDGERGSTGTANLLRRAMVAIEITLAIIVLCGAGLLIKSLSGLMRVDPGLDARDVLTMQVSLPQADAYGPPIRRSFCADLSRAADGVPGIRGIGAVSHLPLSGASAGRSLTIEGRVAQSPEDGASATYRMSCPGYFAALGIAVLKGRDFSDRDVTTGEKVTIVNRTMADRYWPNQDPIGKRLKIGSLDNDNPWMTVVGVIDNVRHFGLDNDVRPEFYAPYTQLAWPVMTIVAKTAGEPMLWQSSMRDVVRNVDPDLPIAQVRPMDAVVSASVAWRETPMKLLSGFAVVGLLLASIGVYGVLAYYVSQRTREIGVRAALGASKRQLASLVVRQSLLPMIAGAIVGVTGSLATGRLLQDFLYEVEPGDPQVIVSIVTLLVVVGLLASYLPARRAAAIDPMVALRDE